MKRETVCNKPVQ